MDSITFDHSETEFALNGEHINVSCIKCHIDMIFSDTPMDCNDCHTDIHNQTEGNDCMRCHNTTTWIVDNIPELHEANGFSLTGAHVGLRCDDCHFSDSNLRFDRIGNDCINCHLDNYERTSQPDHMAAGYGKECTMCHDAFGTNWSVNHDLFYPLVGAHARIENDCNKCHTNGFSNTPNTCVGCHQANYDATTDPDHRAAQVSTECNMCHSEIAWRPAAIDHDGQYFPIYSGKHEGEWNVCADCHTNGNSFAIFSCIDCHEHSHQGELDGDHDEVSGYKYESNACFACHPTGDE